MIAILGDVHGGMRRVVESALIACNAGASALIQVGDFGFSDAVMSDLRRTPATVPIPVYVIDGNHEDYRIVAGFSRDKPTLIGPNIYYVPRGLSLAIDGRRVLFVGGAASIDKAIRLRLGWHWFEAEVVTEEDCARALAEPTPDIIVTHCPPQSVITKHFETPEGIAFKTGAFGVPADWSDPSAPRIETIWEHHGKPPLYCGHMHRSITDGNVRILNIDELVFSLSDTGDKT